MARLGILPSFICVTAALCGASASACSPPSNYRFATNLEHVRDADLIVLGKVVDGKSGDDDPANWSITLSPLVTIKGTAPDGPIDLTDMTLTEGESAIYGMLSNPFEFHHAHPDSYSGGCIRHQFPRGTTALFFLDREDGGWRPSGGVFSRWAEDVPGEGAPWIELVRLYVQAAALPDEQRIDLLEGRRSELAGRLDDPVAQLMAADVSRQLGADVTADAEKAR